MMKIDPFRFRRPEREVIEVRIDDPVQAEVELLVRLRALSVLDEYLVVDRCEELVERYITGSDDRQAVSFPAIDGEGVVVTRSLCRVVASLEVMQVVDRAEDRYLSEQLIAMAVTLPELWVRLVEVAEKLQGGVSKKL